MVDDPPDELWRRFRLRPGFAFKANRPPNVVYPMTDIAMNAVKLLRSSEIAAKGVYIYHYSCLFHHQINDRITYNQNYGFR